ncbi:hypothetical protein ACE6H2_019709 [Prunus campanulata]
MLFKFLQSGRTILVILGTSSKQHKVLIQLSLHCIKLAMGKDMSKPWVEVAPSLLDFPWKGSSSPKLETILEELAEDYSDDDD